jgi:hypothetical protein
MMGITILYHRVVGTTPGIGEALNKCQLYFSFSQLKNAGKFSMTSHRS